MGNHRFRLSDMIPNTWFHKLKDMGRARDQKTNRPRKKKPPPTSSKSTTSTSSSSSSIATAIPPQHSNTGQPHLLSHHRKSYYFTRDLTPSPPPPPPPPPQPANPKLPETHFPDSPRKSSSKQRNRRRSAKQRNRVVTSSASASCSCRATVESIWTDKPDSTSDDYPIFPLDSFSDLQSLFPQFGSDSENDHDHGMVSCSASCHCRVQNDIVIDINDKSSSKNFDGFVTISKLELSPIVTKKPTKFTNGTEDTIKPEKQRSSSVRSPGVRLRTNSPRIASRKIQSHGRRSVSSSCRRGSSLSESFAVVKTSADPQRDFRESMVEMILENNLRASKELEDLLACYLQLNSDEYHEVIVKVFKQIWFDLAGVRVIK